MLAGAATAHAQVNFSSPAVVRVGADPARMVTADLNGDGNPDLLTADWHSGTVSVVFGTGDGRFLKRVAYEVPRHLVGLSAGDIDGDGDPDVVTASDDPGGTVAVLVNRGDGRLRRARMYRTGFEANAVAIGDIDADRDADLVTAHDGRRSLGVLLGTRRGRFRVARMYRGSDGTDVALADFNGDGKLDVALALSRLTVRLGRGDGRFGPAHSYRSGVEPWGVTVADLNVDGYADIAVADYSGQSAWVHLGAGDGTFAAGTRYRSPGPVESVSVADFDGDGILDIATPEDGRDEEYVFAAGRVRRGLGDGTFGDAVPIAPRFGVPTLGGAVADFDRDGRPDLAFSEGTDWVRWDWEPPRSRRAYVFLNRGQAG